MGIQLRGCTFNEGHSRWFRVASNRMQYFEIGVSAGSGHWLEAQQVGPAPEEFVFNGRLFMPLTGAMGTVIDNFPKSPAPRGWEQRRCPSFDGFELFDPDTGFVLFGYRVIDNICLVTTNLYDRLGGLIAETVGEDFLIHSGPARLGRHGIHISAHRDAA